MGKNKRSALASIITQETSAPSIYAVAPNMFEKRKEEEQKAQTALNDEKQEAPPSPPVSDAVSNALEKLEQDKEAHIREQIGERFREQNREHNRGRIREQKHNQGTIRERNREQFGEQSGNVIGNKTENKKGNELENVSENKLENKTGNESGNSFENIALYIKRLNGLQADIFEFVLHRCLSSDTDNSGPILTKEIEEKVGCSYESVKMSLKRLIKKNLVVRLPGQASRGGYINLEIPKEVKKIWRDVTGNKSGNVSGNNLENDALLRRRSDLIKPSSSDLTEEWLIFNAIDIDPEFKDFGITEKKVLYSKGVALQTLKEELPKLAYSMKNKTPAISGVKKPIGLFINKLCNGDRWPEPLYVSPEELLKIEREKNLMKMLDGYREIEFSNWFNGLNEAEKESYVSHDKKENHKYQFSKEVIQKEEAKKHFENKIWPARQDEMKSSLGF